MANLIEAAKMQIDELVKKAYQAAAEKGILPEGIELKGTVEIPKRWPMGTMRAAMPWRPRAA